MGVHSVVLLMTGPLPPKRPASGRDAMMLTLSQFADPATPLSRARDPRSCTRSRSNDPTAAPARVWPWGSTSSPGLGRRR